MGEQSAIPIMVGGIVAIIVLVAMASQMAYAWTLKVDVSDSEFGVERANVGIRGPYGYTDALSVETSPTASVTFNIPDNEVPNGSKFEVCTSSGLLSSLIPTCRYWIYQGGSPVTISMPVPG
jgi:hypothetical protein